MIEINYIGRDSIFDFSTQRKLFAYNIGDLLIIQNLQTSEKMKALQHQNPIKSILFIDDNEIMSTDGERLAIQQLDQLYSYAQIKIPSEERENLQNLLIIDQISSIKTKDFLVLIYSAECGYRMTVLTYRDQHLRIVLSTPLEAQNKFLKIINLSQEQFIICERQSVKIWLTKDKELSLKNKLNFNSNILDITTNLQDKFAFVLTEKADIHLITQQGIQLMKISTIPPTTQNIAYLNQNLYIATPEIQRFDLFDSSLTPVQSEFSIPIKQLYAQTQELIVVHENEAISFITPGKKNLQFFSLNPKIVKVTLIGPETMYILTPYYLYKFQNNLEVLFESEHFLSAFFRSPNELILGTERGQIYKNGRWLIAPDNSKIDKIFQISGYSFFLQNQTLFKINRQDKFETILQDVLKIKVIDQSLFVLTGWGIHVYSYQKNLVEQFKISGHFSLDFQMHKSQELIFSSNNEGIQVFGTSGKYKGKVADGDFYLFKQDPSGLYLACIQENWLQIIEVGTRKSVASYEVQDVTDLVFSWDWIGLIKGAGMVFVEIPEDVRTNIFEAMKMQVKQKDFWKKLYLDFEDQKMPSMIKKRQYTNDQQTIPLNSTQPRQYDNINMQEDQNDLNNSFEKQFQLSDRQPPKQKLAPQNKLNQQLRNEIFNDQNQKYVQQPITYRDQTNFMKTQQTKNSQLQNNIYLNKINQNYQRPQTYLNPNDQNPHQFLSDQLKRQNKVSNKFQRNQFYNENNLQENIRSQRTASLQNDFQNQQIINQQPFQPIQEPLNDFNHPLQDNYQKHQIGQQQQKELILNLNNMVEKNEVQDLVRGYQKSQNDQFNDPNQKQNVKIVQKNIISPQSIMSKVHAIHSPQNFVETIQANTQDVQRYQELLNRQR